MSVLQQNEKKILASLNHYSFFGAFAQQNPKSYLSINRLLNARNFDTIIELGTHDGGLSALLAFYCFLSKNKSYCENSSEPSLYKNSTHHKSPKQFYTFDIVKRDLSMINLIDGLGGTFLQLDTLHNKANIASIGELIKRGGSTLLICDGGDKKAELDLYGGFLKTGDVVMAHDWAKDKEAHQRNKDSGTWSGWEIRWENGVAEDEQFGIKDICEKHKIMQIFSEEFDDCAWFCGVKT
jgi:hypothetical protein